MAQMHKGLSFGQRNTVTELRAPSAETDAIRLVDLNTAKTALDSAIASGDTLEIAASLQTSVAAQIATLEAAYQTADTNLTNQLSTQLQAIVSGFTIKDPVYALVNSTITLSGLTVSSGSFSGTIPADSRILTVAQGGGIETAHQDNRVWVAKAGAWVAASDFDESSEILRSVLISVENGTDNYGNTIYSLVEPAIFTDAVVGTTPLRWARWQGNDRVIADGTSIARTGITFSARLNSDDLIVDSQGIAINPTMKALLQDLSNATGMLPTSQITGLSAYILANPLNTFAAPTAAVDLSNQKLINVADPTLATDAVNLQTYEAGLAALTTIVDSKDFGQDLTSGSVVNTDTVFTITHGLGSLSLIKEVFDKTTGETAEVDFVRDTTNLNSCQIIFRNETAITSGQYRLLLHKVS
jgi:hypothetical protein